jgi:hypothetical protein
MIATRTDGPAAAPPPGAALGQPAVAVVPANTRRLTTLPARRRRALREYLRECIDEAWRLGGLRRPRLAPDGTESGGRARLAAACATCRGHCCGRGGDHAFLDIDAMRGYIGRTRPRSPAAVLRAFLRHVPAHSYRDSCVYHGRDGCTLPRTMRANVCNVFYCKALHDQRDLLTAMGKDPLLIGAADGLRLVRLQVLDRTGDGSSPRS